MYHEEEMEKESEEVEKEEEEIERGRRDKDDKKMKNKSGKRIVRRKRK